MKKQLCCILTVLLCGCSPVSETDENKSKIVYAAAEYCADDECSEKSELNTMILKLKN